MSSAQRRVAVKRMPFSGHRTRACVLALALVVPSLATSARAEDLPTPTDAPRARLLPSGDVLMNKKAWDLADNEMKRLQAVERDHKNEQKPNFLPAFFIGAGLGLLIGAAVAVPVTISVVKK